MANESDNMNNSSSKPDKSESSGKSVMSAVEKELHEFVGSGSLEDVRRLLAEKVCVDCPDEHGMTPLQHAAYKGNEKMCQLLLSHGADVNDLSHEHGYTTLMFGALSGSKQVVKLLLEHGACVGLENSVHKTASQMAAFIGQHEIVSLINNFFPRADLEYYCVARGLEKEPKLDAAVAPALYKFIQNVNLNPIHLALLLRQHTELLDQANRVVRLLDTLCEKQMKQRSTNEILAMKFCYLSNVIKHAAKSYTEHRDTDNAALESWIKLLLRVDTDGVYVHQEKLVRSMLSEFPYVECQLLQQMVRTLATPSLGGASSALGVLTSCINGQRFAGPEDKMCVVCGELNGKTCVNCHTVNYCDKQCQRLHWTTHKKHCKQLASDYAQLQQQTAADQQDTTSQTPVGDLECEKSRSADVEQPETVSES